jgi:3-methylfumaryl-CoA hydratase
MNLESWLGRSETSTDVITATPYAALSATLDRSVARPPEGTPLPPLWHWLYFLPLYKESEVGPDGHARRGEFLPPVPLPRRMWAGSEFEFRRPLCIGDQVTRVSTISGISEKAGRSGSLVFVKVRRELRRSGEPDLAIAETHDIVYREAARPGASAQPPAPAPDTAAWERKVVPDAVLLFRYSALTFNGHRIHYDRRYVTEVESYPGLIVHGPLIATLLLDLLREHRPDAAVARFTFRASSPLFDTDPFFVCGEPASDGKTVRLWAKDHRGGLAMEATAIVA